MALTKRTTHRKPVLRVVPKKAKRKRPQFVQVDIEDIRDDCIAIFRNSGLTQKQVHEQGGPTKSTISKWLYRETKRPQFNTLRALLQACGHDFQIAPSGEITKRSFE